MPPNSDKGLLHLRDEMSELLRQLKITAHDAAEKRELEDVIMTATKHASDAIADQIRQCLLDELRKRERTPATESGFVRRRQFFDLARGASRIRVLTVRFDYGVTFERNKIARNKSRAEEEIVAQLLADVPHLFVIPEEIYCPKATSRNTRLSATPLHEGEYDDTTWLEHFHKLADHYKTNHANKFAEAFGNDVDKGWDESIRLRQTLMPISGGSIIFEFSPNSLLENMQEAETMISDLMDDGEFVLTTGEHERHTLKKNNISSMIPRRFFMGFDIPGSDRTIGDTMMNRRRLIHSMETFDIAIDQSGLKHSRIASEQAPEENDPIIRAKDRFNITPGHVLTKSEAALWWAEQKRIGMHGE